MSDAAADRVRQARSARSSAESASIYSEWAATYDADVFDELGFTGSSRVADLLAEHAPDRSVAVLDIGCGTGAVGVRLAELGFGSIDGVDISAEMLAVAETKLVYRRLDTCDLTAGRPLPAGGYGASVSAGTFTSGHVGPAHLAPIVDALDRGALVAWVIAQPVWPEFERALADHRFDVLSSELEAVRAGGVPESVMLVARLGD